MAWSLRQFKNKNENSVKWETEAPSRRTACVGHPACVNFSEGRCGPSSSAHWLPLKAARAKRGEIPDQKCWLLGNRMRGRDEERLQVFNFWFCFGSAGCVGLVPRNELQAPRVSVLLFSEMQG